MLIITTDGHIETRQLKASDQYFSLALIQTQRPRDRGPASLLKCIPDDNIIWVQTHGFHSFKESVTRKHRFEIRF